MTAPPSTTVLKAFDLLALFSQRPLLGAGEAARLLGAPRASTHRLLVTLRLAGVLEVNEDGQYRLGLRLFELGSYAPLRRRLHDECTQPLERLSAEVALPTFLGAREGTDLLCLEKVYHRQTDVPIRVGQRAPLHTTAAGKVLLAYARRSVIKHYLMNPSLGSHRTPSSSLVDFSSSSSASVTAGSPGSAKGPVSASLRWAPEPGTTPARSSPPFRPRRPPCRTAVG
jgi:DNA-binding IclR family transcriptional regulator